MCRQEACQCCLLTHPPTPTTTFKHNCSFPSNLDLLCVCVFVTGRIGADPHLLQSPVHPAGQGWLDPEPLPPHGEILQAGHASIALSSLGFQCCNLTTSMLTNSSSAVSSFNQSAAKLVVMKLRRSCCLLLRGKQLKLCYCYKKSFYLYIWLFFVESSVFRQYLIDFSIKLDGT